METVKIVILCLGALSIASATPTPEARESSPQHSEYEYNYDNEAAQPSQAQEPAESASHYDAYIQDVQQAATGGGGGKKGYSSGSGLRTIAVGSANQAKTALGNQAAAAYQAAYVAKNTLAQSAAQASATAQAALAGKQVILSGLEQQVRDAKVALQAEEMQLQQAKRAAQAAAQAAQQAMHQVNVIQAALNAAQATSENANEGASLAAGELGAQTAMVGAARQRLHTLQEQLHGVRIDFEATQSAARKAQAAAQQAQANAAAAAAKAAAAGLGGSQHHDASHEEWSSPIVEVHHVHQTSAKPFHRHHHRNPSKPLLTFELSGSASEHSNSNIQKSEDSDEVENLPVTVQTHSDHPHNALSHFDYSSPTTQVNYELSSLASEQSEVDVQNADKSDEAEIVSIPAKSQSNRSQKTSSRHDYSSTKPPLDLSSPAPNYLKTSAQKTESNLIEITPTPTQSYHSHALEASVYNHNVSLSKAILPYNPIRVAPEHPKPNLPQQEYNTFEIIPIPVTVQQSVRVPLQSYSNYPAKAFLYQNYSVQRPQFAVQPSRLVAEHSRRVVPKTETNRIQIATNENANRLPIKSHINHPLRAYNRYPPQYTPQVAVVDNVNSQTKVYPVVVPYKAGYKVIDTRKRSAAKQW